MKHTPRKRFGQNFLRDPHMIDAIIDAIDLKSNDRVVEIGPGQGALTNHLLEQVKLLHVVELDRDLVRHWQQLAADMANGDDQNKAKLKVHSADALKLDFHPLACDGPLRLVGNLPYNISTPLLFHFSEQMECFDDLHVMLQREVAERMSAAPGSKIYGRLSVMLQALFEMEPLLEIPPESFYPAPKVTSTFLRMTPLSQPLVAVSEQSAFAHVVRQAFSQRRKTLRKSLAGTIEAQDFERCGIDSGLRPEALSVEQFAALAKTFKQRTSQDG